MRLRQEGAPLLQLDFGLEIRFLFTYTLLALWSSACSLRRSKSLSLLLASLDLISIKENQLDVIRFTGVFRL